MSSFNSNKEIDPPISFNNQDQMNSEQFDKRLEQVKEYMQKLPPMTLYEKLSHLQNWLGESPEDKIIYNVVAAILPKY